MTATDEMLRSAEEYARRFDRGDLAMPPGRKVAVLTCMDARINPYGLLGLREGDGHVIRNAGGLATDDAIRSLAISQHLLGTAEILLIHHTDCGMLTFTDDELAERLEREAGECPGWRGHAFDDLEASLREQLRRVKESPFVPRKDSVRGFVYEVETGRLREVS